MLHNCALTLPSQNQAKLKKQNFQNIIFWLHNKITAKDS